VSIREADALNEANRQLKAGHLAAAREICLDLLQRNRLNVKALEILAAAAFQDALYDEARTCLQRCIRLKPRDALYPTRMAQVYATEGRFTDALSMLDRAQKTDPRHAVSPGLKASLFRITGAEDKARDLLEPIIRAGTEDAEAAHEFAQLLLKADRSTDAVDLASRHLDDQDASPNIRRQLLYLIGRAHHKLGHIDHAFQAYRRANELNLVPFDPDQHIRFVDRLVETFSSDRLPAMPHASNASELPVIIAGMPRSGTTLIEQIIDAHPDAHGGGEMPDLTRLVRRLPKQLDSDKPFPECAADLTPHNVDRVAKPYLDRLRRIGRRAKRVVNKNLDNHLYLGLVALLFPNARIIHSRRDPLDTCFSCYTTHLLPENQPYASNLEHLGLAYRQYERLMDHWRTLPGLEILDVQYEQLVADQESHSRRIIDFLALQWDDRCLRFYDSGRVAGTLSYDQVTRPIYTSSVGRHKRYEKHLQPLKRALQHNQGRL